MKKQPTMASRTPPYHHLLPYLASVVVSLVFFAPDEAPTGKGLALKCFPIVLLTLHLKAVEGSRQGEAKWVYRALQFSVVGDAFLVWPDQFFIQGILFFAVAQILYIKAFGFREVSIGLGAIPLYGLSLIVLVLILPGLPTPLRVAVPVYALIITTMLWRAVDRARLRTDLSQERRLSSLLGAVIFVISDLCIATLQVGQLIPHAYAQVIILLTYYLAQLFLVLGSFESFWERMVVTPKKPKQAKKEREKKEKKKAK
ncbi:lysoplasmalogenase-like protein TMEM86A [Penaeus monodon]|uniref:lysoplasmalogenase-like protein TMEM86A n=1 Tax=Penaeus monodon TaxID=6687 RepID=UPI0018A7BB2B|nr:lysoplasmalogenase-like protein TMEM86A [Penaeus monodon]